MSRYGAKNTDRIYWRWCRIALGIVSLVKMTGLIPNVIFPRNGHDGDLSGCNAGKRWKEPSASILRAEPDTVENRRTSQSVSIPNYSMVVLGSRQCQHGYDEFIGCFAKMIIVSRKQDDSSVLLSIMKKIQSSMIPIAVSQSTRRKIPKRTQQL